MEVPKALLGSRYPWPGGLLSLLDPTLQRYMNKQYCRLVQPSYRDVVVIFTLCKVLYLEAEAAGVRGTGIGCFYDDPVHDVMGIRAEDIRLQSLYHFTIGGPVEDLRLQTLQPYVFNSGRPRN